MGVWTRRCEAALLAGAGAFMVWLALSPMYWRFLNPRTDWLTLGTGACLALLGLVRFVDARAAGAKSALLGLAVLLAVALAATTLPNPLFDADPATGLGPSLTATGPAPDPGARDVGRRLELDGREYLPMNAAEMLAAESLGELKAGDRLVLRGMVARTPGMDRDGYIAVARLYIVCCFADAVGVAWPVRVDDPGRFKAGEWVRAAGTVRPVDAVPDTSDMVMPGSLFTASSQSTVLDAEQVEPTDQPPMPFIFEVRQAEPYNY